MSKYAKGKHMWQIYNNAFLHLMATYPAMLNWSGFSTLNKLPTLQKCIKIEGCFGLVFKYFKEGNEIEFTDE